MKRDIYKLKIISVERLETMLSVLESIRGYKVYLLILSKI